MIARQLTNEELSAMCAQLLTRLEQDCSTCEHCDLEESDQGFYLCTNRLTVFNGKFLPSWVRGCPFWEKRS